MVIRFHFLRDAAIQLQALRGDGSFKASRAGRSWAPTPL
jgi:hypothetical protein